MRSLLIVGLCAALALTIVRCGDDDGGSTDGRRYFEKIGAGFEIVDKGFATLPDPPGPDAPLERRREVLLRTLEQSSDLMGEYIVVLETAQPPAELAGEHAAYVEAARGVVAYWAGVQASVRAALSVSDFDAVLFGLSGGSAEYQAAFNRYNETCFPLLAAAQEQGIQAKLPCAPHADE